MIAADRITFDEASHSYTLDGKPVDSVTQIMDGYLSDYSTVPADVLARASARGTAVHRAAELWLQDDLDESTLHEEVATYFYQFVRWHKQSGFKLEYSELRVASEKYQYTGTLDLAGTMPKSYALIDIKTTSVFMPSTGPQTAAYEQGFRETTDFKKRVKRFGLHLRPDSYALMPLEDTSDFRTFLACLTLRRWNNNHK